MALTLQQLKQGAVWAKRKGDMDAARRFLAAAKREQARQPTGIEGAWNQREGVDQFSPETTEQAPPPTLSENVIGAGETGLAITSGMTTGAAGSIAGALEGLAKEIIAGEFGKHDAATRIEQLSRQRAEQATYAPKTDRGQEMTQAVGNVMEPLAALSPPAAIESRLIAEAGRNASGAGRAIASSVIDKTALQSKIAADSAVDKAKQVGRFVAIGSDKTPEIDVPENKSMGAAMLPLEQKRIDDAASIGIKLRESQVKRDPYLESEVHELKKHEVIGKPIRDDEDLQNKQLGDYAQKLVDDSGSMLSELPPEQGLFIANVFEKGLKRAERKVKVKYKKLERSDVWNKEVDPSGIGDYLNENSSRRITDDLMGKVQRQLKSMKLADGNFENEDLNIKKMTFGQSEELRQFINSEIDWSKKNDKRVGGNLKKFIDDEQDKFDTKLVKEARDARIEQAHDYENMSLISNILSTKKGKDDRKIKIEDTMKAILSGSDSSLESITRLKETLGKIGPDGKQAWKEIQGGTFQHLMDSALKNVGTTRTGETKFYTKGLETALRPLVSSGKLEVLVGKEKARQLTTLLDVAKYAATKADGGLINWSGSGGKLMQLMDFFLSNIPGAGAFVLREAISKIKDKKLRARVQQEMKRHKSSFDKF